MTWASKSLVKAEAFRTNMKMRRGPRTKVKLTNQQFENLASLLCKHNHLPKPSKNFHTSSSSTRLNTQQSSYTNHHLFQNHYCYEIKQGHVRVHHVWPGIAPSTILGSYKRSLVYISYRFQNPSHSLFTEKKSRSNMQDNYTKPTTWNANQSTREQLHS
jgi:hypothetical protein